ncbi:collagen-like protein, partial [Coleofasciculus sp. LEGE 07081]
GRGGRPGRGAYSGEGCQCQDRRWEREICKGSPGSSDYHCTTEKFYCEDGREGRDGRDGRDGKEGQLGTLTLIQRSEVLPPDRPTATLAMPELKDKIYRLSLNQWQTKGGTASLLAPGSVIADQYREFLNRIDGSFQLVWNSDRSIADFYNQKITLNLKEDKQVEVSLPEEVWWEGTTSQENGVTQLVISNAILEREATELTRADFLGNGQNLTFSLVDLAGKSDLISTQFWIKYRTASGDRFRRFYDYRTRYEGNIPAELVTRNNNRFTLNLGKLPIEREFLKPGVPLDVELVAIRSFAGHSAEQKITWQGEIKR